MGRKCGISVCLSDSNREEDRGVTFHKIPMHPDIRPKWMSLCRIPEDKKSMKVIYVCSRHFLKVDFCHFKGKKYMLRQGVLPSVFPWNKSKDKNKSIAEQIESGKDEVPVKMEVADEIPSQEVKLEVTEHDFNAGTSLTLKTEDSDMATIKEEVRSPNQSTTIEQKVKTVETTTGLLTFAPNTRIEALDFNQSWCPAQIVEVDYQENEVLVHFEKYSNKYDEWICMNSNTLRAFRPDSDTNPSTSNVKKVETYEIGERCLASWSNARKFPATVSKIIDKDTYEVIFDDGFVKVLKAHRMAKANGKALQSSPLFDPVRGSKQERRDRKRKINVAALFGKRIRQSSQDDGAVSQATESATNSPSEELEHWTPTWENGRPVGEESVIETTDGTKESIIVPDPRLPPHWVKHLAQRASGASAGKWNCIIVNPDGRKFRARSDIKAYVDEHPELNLTESMFDFSLFRKSRRSYRDSKPAPVTEAPQPPPRENSPSESPYDEEIVTDLSNCLKIPIVDNAYKCPIEGCGKNFRRENLAQMHVKHYHPEYTKYLDSTPNVADLAYARTVGESLDRSPGQEKPKPTVPKPVVKAISQKSTPTPKASQSPSYEVEQIAAKVRDSEIIKLLSAKPAMESNKKEERPQSPILPSGLPPSMYPDIKLKDLLIKSEAIPKRDDLNLKTLSASTQRPTGIKTLLPVTRPENKKKEDDESQSQSGKILNKNLLGKHSAKRKRNVSDSIEKIKEPKEPVETVVKPEVPTISTQQSNNVIIEGGEVIKIVQMRREEIINCTCGITEEDGLMIQCELCLCWQHAYCNNIERESQVPEKYICYICQNPARQRISKKYFHDQDWLKNGTLPVGNYHCKDDQLLKERFEMLKKSHDLSGALLELKDYLHTLKVKTKIAQAKNHPKSYLWSKPWEKLPLPEKMEFKDENENTKQEEVDDHGYSKNDEPGDSVLLSLLKPVKDEIVSDVAEFPKIDLNTLIENNLDQVPVSTSRIPQPEAAIDSADCRLNLLEHIQHSQSLVEERLNDFEEQINKICSVADDEEKDEQYPKLRQTTQMIMRDLNVFKELSQMTSF